MIAKKSVALLFASLFTILAHAQFKQEFFIIGTYGDPPLFDEKNLAEDIARLQLAKDAYFNLLTGTQDDDYIDRSEAGIAYSLELASQLGLKYLVTDERFWVANPFVDTTAAQMMKFYQSLSANQREALYGYNIVDEPKVHHAATVKQWINFLKSEDSTKLAFVNLLPSYGFEKREEFENYLDLYISSNRSDGRLDVLSYDHYPVLKDRVRGDYFYNMQSMLNRTDGRPIWAYINTSAHLVYPEPTSSQLRFMAFCPIAYGAKGLIYFKYDPGSNLGPVALGSFAFTSSPLVDENGEPDQKYYTAQQINHFVHNLLGPIVMQSELLDVNHVSDQPTREPVPNQIYGGTPIVWHASNPNLLLSVFEHQQREREYNVLLVNKNFSNVNNVTVVLKGNHTNNISLSPSVVDYAGDTVFTAVTGTYDEKRNETTIILDRLHGGEGRLLKLENVQEIFTLYTHLPVFDTWFYPNPVESTAKLFIKLPYDASLSFSVYDHLGRRVMQVLEDGFRAKGVYDFEVDLSSLSQGIYYVNLLHEDRITARKLIKN